MEKSSYPDESVKMIRDKTVDDMIAEGKDRKNFIKKITEAVVKMKKDRKFEIWVLKIWQDFYKTFNPDKIATFIQSFENLLFVLFVDIILITILFSVLYMLYIIITSENIDLTNLIVKIVGSTIICVIGIIIQVNIGKQNKNEKEDD